MRRSVTAATVLAVCMSLSACGASSAPTTKRMSMPEAMNRSISAAALAQKSVHWTETAVSPCPKRWTSDVRADSGTQQFTIDCGVYGKGKGQVVLVDDVAYVRSDPVGLKYTLFLPEALARKYAGRWISVPKGNGLYAQTADGLTLASIVHDSDPFKEGGKLKLSRKSSRRGRELLVLEGRNWPYHLTLAAQPDGARLPIAFVSTSDCAYCRYRVSFSKWNEPIHVQTPARSTPIASVCGRCRHVIAAANAPHG